MKQLQNNFTTHEQSKRLLELGVPADSADQVYYGDIVWGAHEFLSPEHPYSETVKRHGNIATPCWSVGRLIEIFKKVTDRVVFLSRVETIDYSIDNIDAWIYAFEYHLSTKEVDFSKLEE